MIKTIMAGGQYSYVTGGNNTHTYITGHPGLQGVGNLRFNTTTQNMEVFDGSTWITLALNHATVGLTADAERILNWAKVKMLEELEVERLAKENPTVNDLLKQVKEKQEQLKVVTTLLKSPETLS
jgi:hypothetical protein